jgi:hypothetical protein
MKRVLFAVVLSSALLTIGPATAVARPHHARHHRHHARIHRERFGTSATSQTGQTGTSSGNAGTVASFTNGVLTITLADGSTVAGRVSDATELECTTSSGQSQSGDDSGDNSSSTDSQSSGSSDQSSGSGDQSSGSDNQSSGSGDNQSSGSDNQSSGGQTCATAALTPGAVVREAELAISSSGATWQKLELQS